jgi:DNA polymerase I-like protein with 3'-5' exonuclease and polymerase domains
MGLPNVRKLFIPDPGYTFFDIDLDSADLRIVQREARIKEMGQMLAEGKKVYVEVGREFYKDPTFSKHHKHYRTFKSFAHGTHYLGSAKGLAERIGLPVHEVEMLQKWYYGKFPELEKWHNDFKNQVVTRRYVENVFGYRMYIFDRIEGTIFNQAVAWVPQSTVACIINRGYMKIYKERKEIQVLLQVHDSLSGQYPTHLGDWAKREIKRCCEIELPYPEPMVIPVDIKTSTESWGACE